MLAAELLKFLVDFGHLVRSIVVVAPEFEDLLGAKNNVDTMVVLEASGISSELTKEGRLGKKVNRAIRYRINTELTAGVTTSLRAVNSEFSVVCLA